MFLESLNIPFKLPISCQNNRSSLNIEQKNSFIIDECKQVIVQFERPKFPDKIKHFKLFWVIWSILIGNTFKILPEKLAN